MYLREVQTKDGTEFRYYFPEAVAELPKLLAEAGEVIKVTDNFPTVTLDIKPKCFKIIGGYQAQADPDEPMGLAINQGSYNGLDYQVFGSRFKLRAFISHLNHEVVVSLRIEELRLVYRDDRKVTYDDVREELQVLATLLTRTWLQF